MKHWPGLVWWHGEQYNLEVVHECTLVELFSDNLMLKLWLGRNTALLDVCMYVYPFVVPNPVMIRVDPSQDLCPNRNPNTVTLTWNQPTRFRECISRYTLETTTARGSRTTSVTSNTTSVSVGCCLRYNFTVTPSYTRSPTGQGTTRNIPLSFVSGQSSKSIMYEEGSGCMVSHIQHEMYILGPLWLVSGVDGVTVLAMNCPCVQACSNDQIRPWSHLALLLSQQSWYLGRQITFVHYQVINFFNMWKIMAA